MFRRFSALTIIIVVPTALAILAGGVFLGRDSAGKIIPGVYSAGVPLGGMTPENAVEALREKFGGLENEELILEGEGRQWKVPMKDIGAYYDFREAVKRAYDIGHSGAFTKRISELLGNRTGDMAVPLKVGFDREALKRELERINSEYAKVPRNARIQREGRDIRVTPAQEGIELDPDETMRKILSLCAGEAFRVKVVSKTVAPQVREEDLSGITDVLGECTTWFDADSESRARNIATASERIDGALIRPGEVFSFNSKVSPVDGKDGFERAPVIIDNRLVDDYGGGICQVATTLYGAVLISGLEIVERYPHSKPVKYVPPGLDATVSDGMMDFRFKNNLGRPVYIISAVDNEDGSVKITIAGQKEQNVMYKIYTEEKVVSPGIIIKNTSRIGQGHTEVIDEGSPGFEVTVYRVAVHAGGVEKKEIISDDFYPPDPKVIEVGQPH